MTNSTVKTVKAVNYTPEQEATLSALWIAGESAEKIALVVGKSTRSVVAKLVRMFPKDSENAYKAKSHVRKDGAPVQKKNDTATAIGAVLGLSDNDTDSLTKCTRATLQAIFKALANSVPLTPENDVTFAGSDE